MNTKIKAAEKNSSVDGLPKINQSLSLYSCEIRMTLYDIPLYTQSASQLYNHIYLIYSTI